MKRRLVALLVSALTLFIVPSLLWADYLPAEEQLNRALALLPEIGKVGEWGVSLEVGEPIKPGVVAHFVLSPQGELVWGLEEWTALPDGNLTKRYWFFYRGYATHGEAIYNGNRIVSEPKPLRYVDITSQEVVAKSELAWTFLMRAGTNI